MAERKVTTARWSRIKRVLKSGSVAEKGQIACIDSTDGSLVPSAVSTTLYPIGYFEDSFTGDGTKQISVRLFSEIDVILMVNSATGTVTDADMCKVCYLRTTPEVSTTATGSSVAGRIWGVTGVSGAGVWVQPLLSGGAAS